MKTTNVHDPEQQAVQEIVQKIPNWETLFGPLSACDCGNCRSIYSPAAYFVDLLQFLRYPNSGRNASGLSPQEVLFWRRPDLEYLKLTCENTNTPLPYVDLVNEILETYVALGKLDASAAHDTGDVTSDELSANPQFVNDVAYDKLKQAVYPFALPFNRPLEAARTYLVHLGCRRDQLMEAFQTGGDPADFTKGSPSGLAIACESLGLSPQEHAVLTGTDLTGKPVTSPPTLPRYYGYHPITLDQSLIAQLGQVPAFLQSTGISYEELVELATTHFLNPAQAITLDVPEDADPCDLTKTTVKGIDKPFLQKAHRFIRLRKALGWDVLDLDKAMRALVATDIDDPVLVKLAQVKRLQAELNLPLKPLLSFWGDIDTEGRDSLYLKLFQNQAVLKPVDSDLSLRYVTQLNGSPTIAFPDSQLERISYDAVTKRLWSVGGMSNRERSILLSLSADSNYQDAIEALYQSQTGHVSAQLAVMPGLAFPVSSEASPSSETISYDPAAKRLQFVGGMTSQERTLLLSLSKDGDYRLGIDNLFQMRWSEGVELAVATHVDGANISTHTAPLLAALRISAVDLTALTANSGGEVTDDVLDLANLSKLSRFTTLAKALRLSVNDLLSIRKLSGLDPFQPGNPAPTVRFVELAGKVRASRFPVTQLNYLYRHAYDPGRGVAPLQLKVDLLVNNLRTGLQKIVADTTAVPDPTGNLLQRKLAVVLDANLVSPMMSLLDGTAVYSTPLAVPLPTDLLFPEGLSSKVRYDAATKQLQFVGAMTDLERQTLLGLLSEPNYQAAVTDLWQRARSATKSFILENLAGLLDTSDAYVSSLINKVQEDRFDDVLTRLLTTIRDTDSRSLVKQVLGDGLGLDTKLTDLLLQKRLRSRTDPAELAMADFLALANGGLSAAYFTTLDLTGSPTHRVDPVIDLAWSSTPSDPSLNPANFSVRWTGKVLARYSEAYTFSIQANDGFRLSVDRQPLIDQWLDQPAVEQAGTIDLKAGQLYEIEITHYSNSSPATTKLSWSSPSTPEAIVPASALYPSSSFLALSLISKAAMLVNNFKMNADEVDYLTEHGADFRGVNPANASETADFDLNALPLDPSESLVAHFAQWERLYDLFTLRDSFPTGEIGLFDVFAAPTSEMARSQLVLAAGWDAGELATLTGTSEDPQTGVTVGFGLTPADFKNEVALIRLRRCWSLIKRLGVSTDPLFHWAAADPDPGQARDIRNTAKAKYDEDTWLTVAKPLNDKLRTIQKNALIAYLLTDATIKAEGITDSSGLYEYFLIDVDMSPCMMTSRIVQACSAIQLYVQRCLMNLETENDIKKLNVSPSAIDAGQWNTWRKQYRLWEANRKVFLYPENWILEELRDDKTPFFKELERELLQNDVTKDTVEQAFLNYLEKLDEVARLDVRAMCWQKAKAVDESDVLHAFGRTFNPPQIYYYRRLVAATGVWTPWEKLSLDIQGDHLIPVVHHGRLFLFWAIFESKVDKDLPELESQAHKDWVTQEQAFKYYQHRKKVHDEWEKKYPLTRDFDKDTKTYGNWYRNPEPPPNSEPFVPYPVEDPGDEPKFGEKSGAGLPAVSHWEIKMAWSEYKHTKWTAKQVCVDPITVPSEPATPLNEGDGPTWELPDQKLFTFGVAYGTSGQSFGTSSQSLVIYVNRAGDHKPLGLQEVSVYGSFSLSDCRGALKTKSSSQEPYPKLTYANPAGTEIDHMDLVELSDTGKLVIDTFPKGISHGMLPYPVLNKTPGRGRVVYPLDDHAIDESVWLGDLYPFFYQDDRGTYFASPEQLSLPAAILSNPNSVGPIYTSASLSTNDLFSSWQPGVSPIFEAGVSSVPQPLRGQATAGAAKLTAPGNNLGRDRS